MGEIEQIYNSVRYGKMSIGEARVRLQASQETGALFPVKLKVREVQPGEKPGFSRQLNFKLSRNEFTFRV